MVVRLAAAVVVACAASGCALAGRAIEDEIVHNLERRHLMCADGAPVLLLQDPRCRSGLCGFTCAPGRWPAKE
jgi:hypothetical protein